MSQPAPALRPYASCPCCGAEYDRAGFAALPRLVRDGRELEGFDDGEVRVLMRNCPCGSTFSVELGPSATGTWTLIPKETTP